MSLCVRHSGPVYRIPTHITDLMLSNERQLHVPNTTETYDNLIALIIGSSNLISQQIYNAHISPKHDNVILPGAGCQGSAKLILLTTKNINTLGPRQNVRRFADDTLKRIFLNENVWMSIKMSLKFVPKVPINNIPALVQIMAWRRPGDKPLSDPMLVSLPTHICVNRPQWVNWLMPDDIYMC